MGRSQLVLLLAAAALARPSLARAQSAEDKAAAETAFEEGKRLMAAEAYAEACPKFAESLRRDPGLGTMLGLADCYEKNGQTASAWAEFREAASVAGRKGDRREALARENAARLEPLLPRLVLRVSPEADIGGLSITRDGVQVGRALWSDAIPLDPGLHAIAAMAPGRRDWQTSIEIPPAPGVRTVTVPRLELAPVVVEHPSPPAAVAPGPTPGVREPGAATSQRAPGEPGRTQRMVALGVAGAGVVGVALGIVFGLDAKSTLDQSNSGGHCDATDGCDGPGLSLRHDAKSAALGSTLGFALGSAAIAGGAILWFTAPREEHPRVGLQLVRGGAGLTCTW